MLEVNRDAFVENMEFAFGARKPDRIDGKGDMRPRWIEGEFIHCRSANGAMTSQATIAAAPGTRPLRRPQAMILRDPGWFNPNSSRHPRADIDLYPSLVA